MLPSMTTPLSTTSISYPIRPYPLGITSHIPRDQLAVVPKLESISKRKYSTSIDPRNYLTVYEYKVNDHWIIWDYHSGLVHLTGLWKAIGNAKADIVKLIDSSPELESELKRVRGGFLKIQGTWVPYKTARKLASKFCYKIRYALIPIFGESFVDECLKPYERGFGMLRLKVNDEELKKKRTRRRRRHNNNNPISSVPSDNTSQTSMQTSYQPTHDYEDIQRKLLPPLPTNIVTSTNGTTSLLSHHYDLQQFSSNQGANNISTTNPAYYHTNTSLPINIEQPPQRPPSFSKSSVSSTSSSLLLSSDSPHKSDGLLSVLKAAEDLDSNAPPISSLSTKTNISGSYSLNSNNNKLPFMSSTKITNDSSLSMSRSSSTLLSQNMGATSLRRYSLNEYNVTPMNSLPTSTSSSSLKLASLLPSSTSASNVTFKGSSFNGINSFSFVNNVPLSYNINATNNGNTTNFDGLGADMMSSISRNYGFGSTGISPTTTSNTINPVATGIAVNSSTAISASNNGVRVGLQVGTATARAAYDGGNGTIVNNNKIVSANGGFPGFLKK